MESRNNTTNTTDTADVKLTLKVRIVSVTGYLYPRRHFVERLRIEFYSVILYPLPAAIGRVSDHGNGLSLVMMKLLNTL
jgi:hypothetical protein